MILAAEQLEADLARHLAPIYLISGDEPLLMTEAADRVRISARSQGYTERSVLTADRYFDWSELSVAGGSMSLFAEKRLIELRMSSSKPGTAGAKALTEFAESPPEDTLLLILAPRMDKRTLRLAWVKRLEGAGRFVQIWPPDRSRSPHRPSPGAGPPPGR